MIGSAAGLGILAYGEGAGCACKADWALLESLSDLPVFREAQGFQTGLRDAATFELTDSLRIATTVDFIGPVSRDASDYGFIAACHALSDLFAIGVVPAAAVAVAAWPSAEAMAGDLREALSGMHAAASLAGVKLVGGHTAYSEQPLLGLCVFGAGGSTRRDTVLAVGDQLFLSKPLGTGIAVGAMREESCQEELERAAIASMRTMNSIGLQLPACPGVKLVSDVTGFGLVGQAFRLAESSGLAVVLEGASLPAFPGVRRSIEEGHGAMAAERNLGMLRDCFSHSDWPDAVLACDPQTNGPLIIVADESFDPSSLGAPASEFAMIGRLDECGAVPVVIS